MEEIKDKVEGQEEITQQQENPTYTQEELDAKLQSETDKRVSQALKTAQDKWMKEYEAKLEAEKTEAEKLAKMSESERQQAELNKMKQDFDNERKLFMREKLELQTVKELSAMSLPTDFSTYVMADTAEQIKENIGKFKTQWETALEKAVNEKLQGTTPKTATQQGTVVTKEQFKKMSIQEKTALFNEDPELYKQLKV